MHINMNVNIDNSDNNNSDNNYVVSIYANMCRYVKYDVCVS